MVGIEPIETYTAFTIMNETGENQSFIVHKADGILESLTNYFEQVLWKTVNIGHIDAKKAANMIGTVLPSILNPFG
jgi:hypothetical protein